MKIAQKYSHLNGEEYLIIHHKSEYDEITKVIESIDACKHRTKVSNEKTRIGELLYNPTSLNNIFKEKLKKLNWHERRRDFFVSTDYQIVKQIEP